MLFIKWSLNAAECRTFMFEKHIANFKSMSRNVKQNIAFSHVAHNLNTYRLWSFFEEWSRSIKSLLRLEII